MKSIIIGIVCIGIICLIICLTVFFIKLPNSWYSLSLLSIPIFLTISECRKVSSFKAKGEYNIRKKCNCSKDCYCGGLFGTMNNFSTGNTYTGADNKEKPVNKEGDNKKSETVNEEGDDKKPETVNDEGADNEETRVNEESDNNEEEIKQKKISKLPLSSYIPPKLVTEYKELIQKQNSVVAKKPTAFDDFMLIQQPLTE